MPNASCGHEVAGRLAGEEGLKVFERAEAHGVARFERGAAEVWEQESVGKIEISRMEVRLVVVDVEPRRADTAGGEGLDQGFVVHDVAARRIHDDGAVRQEGDGLAVDEASCFRRL